MRNLKPANEFGLAMSTFCARYGMSKRQLAAAAGVSYDSMRAAGVDRRPCTAARTAVEAYMKAYEAEAQKGRRKGRGA